MNARSSLWARSLAIVAALALFTVMGAGSFSAASADPDNGHARGHGSKGPAKTKKSGHAQPAASTETRGGSAGATKSGGSGGSTSGTRGKSPSDPDGMENGGLDKPGGQGGTIGAQDGNNGSGNDIDCEDDNRGKGVPGHCTSKPGATKCIPAVGKGLSKGHGRAHGRATKAECAANPTTPGSNPGSNQGGGTIPGGAPTGAAGSPATPPLVSPDAAAEVLGVEAMLGAGAGTSPDEAPNAEVAGVSATAPEESAGPLGGLLPNTGAGQALLLLLLVGAAGLLTGAAMLVRRGRGQQPS